MKLANAIRNLIQLLFGYTLTVFLKRVRYFFYLRFTKIIFQAKLPISIFYDDYIDKEKLLLNINSGRANKIIDKISSLKLNSDDSNEIEKILNNKFNIFNYCFIGNRNASRKDPISGHEWPQNMWYRDARKNLKDRTDIKRPWEYSRMYHLLPVALKFLETNDEKLVNFIYQEVKVWDELNKLGTAPNWSCTMEVAIRLANISISYLLISSAKSLEDKHNFFIKIINNHIGFTYNNLENISRIKSNHYCSNISGLFCSLIGFPLTSSGREVLDFAKNELENEIRSQTLADGWNFELSSAYHRLVQEFFFYPFLLSSKQTFSNDYESILKSMNDVLNNITKPNYQLAQLGDNDSGRFLVFNDFKNLGSLYIESQLNLFNSFLGFKSDSNFFEHKKANVYGYKDDRTFFLIKGGTKGQLGLGGHSHNDTFNFELQINGKDIIFDPGTGCYTPLPEIRNYFRSIKNHNTVFWDSEEEADLEKGLFILRQENKVSIEAKIESNVLHFSGTNKYLDKEHKRAIRFDPKQRQLIISDNVSHDGAKIRLISDLPISDLSNKGFLIDSVRFELDDMADVKLEKGYTSPKYGTILDANFLSIKIPNKEFNIFINLN